MKDILKYLVNFFKVLFWPIIFVVGQFLLVLIFGVYFNINELNDFKINHGNLDSSELTVKFNEYVESQEYKDSLAQFIDSNLLLITIITFVVFIIIFKFSYKKYRFEFNDSIGFKNVLFLILLGVCMNVSYNLIMSSFNNLYKFTNNYDVVNVNLFVSIICTGILGPILEEFLFRGIVFNKLKKFNKYMTSILLTSFVFAFFHSTLIQVLYAFCLSFILIYVYQKYKTIKAPIIVHISSNVVNIFVCLLIMKNIFVLNIMLLLISLVVLFFINKNVIKKDLSV